jgi:hypothetical protein
VYETNTLQQIIQQAKRKRKKERKKEVALAGCAV